MKIESASRIGHVQEYYFSRKLREIAQRRAKGEDIINLGIGSPDLAPHPKVTRALNDAANQSGNHGYQSYRGIPELRNALASFYEDRFEVSLEPDAEILPLLGSKEGIMHLSMAFLDPGDEVLVPNPGYPSYRSAAMLAGATVREYRLQEQNDWFPDLDALASRDLGKVKMMWVNYPHMPTGQRASLAQFDQLIRFAQEQNILLCHDNPYAFILNDKPTSLLQADGALDSVLELTSLSKSFNMAGWRVGALVGRADYLQEVLKFKTNMDSGMFKPIQLAAVEALKLDPDWFDQVNEVYARRRALAIQLLEVIGCEVFPNQVGMFQWAKVVKGDQSGLNLSDELLDQTSVFITPGMIFGSEGENCVRISLCTNEKRLEEALSRVKARSMSNAVVG